MEWADRMNRVVEYVEQNLTSALDPEQISRIMACPYSVFQRSFGPIAGIQFADYVRRRRLSCAASELQNSDQRVLDIAVKYGYDSADAFTVAFKRMHGVTPQEARRPAASLRYQPPLAFALVVAGVTEMEYEIAEKEDFGVLGLRRTTPQGGGTWGIVKSGATMEQIQQLSGSPCNLGLCFGFDSDGNNDYMCASEYQGTPVEGLDSYRVPASTWLVFTAKGPISDNPLGSLWKRIYGEFLPRSEYAQRDLPTIERYVEWDDVTGTCCVEILIPVTA